MKKLISILLALALLVSCITALAEAEPEEYACREENFSTRIPAGTSAAYEEGTGLMIYARSEGNIPYVIVSRRPLDMKFQNPENYLNNVFREYMEDKYGDKFRGMNPAKTWEAGGKELLGARYMYMVGDVQVTLLRLVEVRNGGDVEYTAKYTGDTEEITMAALDTAVRYYRETDNETPEKPEVTELPAPSGTVPAFLIPSEFVTRFNGAMEALADQYADQLGEETARALKDSYTITEKDPQNQILYYGTKDWQIEAAFYYPDDNEPEDTTVARIMNFAIRNDTPEMAANISRRIFEMLIAYEFQNEVSADALHNWFETVNSPEDTFQIPGYTVNAVFPEGYTQYAILPADADIPEGTPDIPVENEPPESPAGTAAQDDGEWMDFHCEEDGFTTRKPYHALTQYKNDKGYVGIAFYLDVPGFPPYVLIHRRPMEGKFKNPEGYLNNTYREFLEDKFAGSSVATNPAKTWEIGGKQLIGAKYTIRDEYGETIQLQLIEVRELGDVEYTAMYSSAEEEALVMKALEAAVANYAEDEAYAGGDYGDDDMGWDQETARAWAEERKAAKEFCDSFSAKLTDRDLLSVILLYDDEYPVTLGKTTPKDLMERGWSMSSEPDGAMLLHDKGGEDTGIILYTEHGYFDEPILTVNAFWDENLNVKYCGFDSMIGIYADDPDEYWYPDPTGRKLYELLYDTGECLGVWDSLAAWLVKDCGAKQSEEGIYEAEVVLKDGRTVYISSHDSPPRVSLIGY